MSRSPIAAVRSGLRLACLACLLSAAVPAAARAAPTPVVAVLYFDNNSGDAAFDVLQKGLADMLISDLAGQGALRVIERARLQALVDEQKLQKTRFFDPKTAVATGKGLGATHAITGAIAAIAPLVRIDVRMIDVATGEVVLTSKVQGPAAGVFDLEQELVQKFLAGLDQRFAAAPLPRTKVKDVATLVEYSRGLDLADRGDDDGAKKKLDAVVSQAPTFGLARLRRDELLERLKTSQTRRDTLVADTLASLAQTAEAEVARPGPDVDEAASARRLAYRALRGNILARRLAEVMSQLPFGVAALGKDAETVARARAWIDNQEHLVAELDQALAAFPSLSSGRLPDDDARRAREAGVGGSTSLDPVSVRLDLAELILAGELRASELTLTLGPPPAAADPALDARGFALLAEAAARAGALDAQRGGEPYTAYRVSETWGDILLLRGRTEDAVAQWQATLDRFPTAKAFANLERRVKRALGLESDATTGDLASWQRGLAECQDMPLRVGLDAVMYQRMRVSGMRGLADTLAEVERSCSGKPGVKQFWEYLASHVALKYGAHGRCADFERLMARSVAQGGSARDVEGWRKNYTDCPHP